MGSLPREGEDEATESSGVPSPGGRLALLIHDRKGVRTSPLPSGGRVVIGRGEDCDLIVDDRSISRRHVALHLGISPLVEDLGSHNGTFVGGVRIEARGRVALPLGATIDLGGSTLVLYRHAAEDGSATAHAGMPSRALDDRGIVVLDPAMQRLYGMLDVIGPSPVSVLLLGETGTGKEVFARAVHDHSKRASQPYVTMSCAALPESLLESELFGYEKGAFTGAMRTKPGLIETADGGTMFLDELGELPATMQAKLLRVLETGELRRLGSVSARRFDVRFVAATNRDLQALVRQNQFRADLFFRLNGFALTLPPLRARSAEIVPFARRFLSSWAASAGAVAPTMTEVAENALLAYAWPGNVRELRQVVDRAATLSRGGPITPAHLMLEADVLASTVPAPPTPSPPSRPDSGIALSGPGTHERDSIVAALAQTSGNQKEASKLLGIPRRTLIRRLEAYGIQRPRKGSGG